jgi:hypothetical protein
MEKDKDQEKVWANNINREHQFKNQQLYKDLHTKKQSKIVRKAKGCELLLFESYPNIEKSYNTAKDLMHFFKKQRIIFMALPN